MRKKVKILVVEDEIPLAMMIVAVLTHAGFDVTSALNGRKGLELATTDKFDLITLDVDLPDLNGFKICAELKQRHLTLSTPVLFLSGRSSQQDVQRGLNAGAVDYLIKPFTAADLVQRILTQVKSQPDFCDSQKEPQRENALFNS